VLLVFYLRASPGAVRDILALPPIAVLMAALFRIFRDDIKHQNALAIQTLRNNCEIGAMSHLANVAFDKHVAFCEEYVAEVMRTLTTLNRRGPCAEAVTHALNIVEIRNKFSVWLTTEIQKELGEFESALITIGNNRRLMDEFPDIETRPELVRTTVELFAQVTDEKEWKGKKLKNDNIGISAILERLREILGVKELTDIRSRLIQRAGAAQHNSDTENHTHLAS
jgi:hypothetical protein